MPKRLDNFFRKSITTANLLDAYKRAAKGKISNKEVIIFEMNLGSNIYNILKDIYYDKYKMGIYRKFIIYEPKKREIMSLPFKDRVVHQWYVESFINPIFYPKLINDTYAYIEGRGVHKAIKKLQHYMKSKYKINPDYYILKCDIRKFFYSINKQILYEIIERKIQDQDFLNFTKKLIFDGTGKVKIPIGNYTSQWFANIYMNELDHYIKEKLNVKYYIRYMDDFVMLLDSKQESKEILEKIKIFLKEKLELELNSKTNYFKNKQGVNFCGYKIYNNKIYIVKGNKRKIFRKVRKWNKLYHEKKLDLYRAADSLKSWEGHASHCTSDGIIKSVETKCEWIYK